MREGDIMSLVLGSWFFILASVTMAAWGLVCSALGSLELCLYWGCASTDGGLSILSYPALASAVVHSVKTMAYHDVTVLRLGVYLVLQFYFSSRPSFSLHLLDSSCLTFFAMALDQPISW